MAATIAAKPSPFHPTNYLGVDLLLSSSTGTGYAGVYFDGSAIPKPYYARFDHAGGSKYLGHFETPALAAVAYAKHGLPTPEPKRRRLEEPTDEEVAAALAASALKTAIAAADPTPAEGVT